MKFIKDRLRLLIAPRSLRHQLLSRSFLILSAILFLIGSLQYVLMEQFLYRSKAVSIRGEVHTIPPLKWLQIESIESIPNEGGRHSQLSSPDTTVVFVDVNGNIRELSESPIDGSAPVFSSEEYLQWMKQTRPVWDYQIVKNNRGIEQLVVLEPIRMYGQLLGIVQVSTSTRPLKDVLIRQLITFISLASLALAIGLITFLPVLRRTLIPLSKMVDTVERINAGNLSERLPVDQGQMEIDRLAVSFNGMLERLESAFAAEKEAKEQMRRFIADASHELRTPLTSIHGFLEVLLRGGVTSQPEQLQKALASMYSESERLKKLVQDLLLLARLDRTPTIQMKEGLLDDVIYEMEPQLRLLAGDRTVHFSVQSHVRATFDADRIKQVILNLFQNAVQHTDPNHGTIHVSLDRVPSGVLLSVQDNGPGIPKEHLPHLFERFYRIDTSRTRKSGGAGLGLAITKSIVELHGGKVQVESKPGEGSRFSVFLPTDQHHDDHS